LASEPGGRRADTSESDPAGIDRALLARRRSRIALGTLLLLLLVVAGMGTFGIARLYTTSEDRYVKEAFPLRDYARDSILQMVNEETGVRGYLITGDRASLQPYELGHTAVAADLAGLEELIVRRPGIRADVAKVKRRVRALDRYYQVQIGLVAQGRVGRLRAQSHVLAGKARFDQFRIVAERLLDRADRIVHDAQISQRQTYDRTLALVLSLAAAAALIGAALFVILPDRLHRLYQREQEARRAAERGAHATRSLEHVGDAVILLDEHDTIRQWNVAAEQLLGLPEEEALERPAREVVPELAEIDHVLAPARGAAIVPLARDGEERWLAVNESRFAEGRVLVLRDVTAEQRLERTRSDFLATASHELRTPLAAVYGAVRTFRRPDRPSEPELDERLLTMIEQESERLAGIIDQILVSAKLDRGDLHLSRQTCNLRDLCESVLASAGIRASSTHTLALDAPATVSIECDPARLQQVLANLVDNALKYSPEGGRIELRVRPSGETVAIEVADEGIGISPEAQARVFDKFFRVDPEMTSGIGGSGLGLYISQEIARIMGGTITLHSRRGGGSTFTLALPVAAPDKVTRVAS
jgi:PAS domain S-box-containing protein